MSAVKLATSIHDPKERFVDLAISHFHRIAADSFERTAKATAAKVDNVKELLSKGIWYPNDYYRALKNCGQTKRAEWLVRSKNSYHGYAPEPFFSKVTGEMSATKYGLCCFKLKPGANPSEALDSFNTQLSLLDCASTVFLAYLMALRDLLGREKFDHLFASDSPIRLQIRQDSLSSAGCLFETIPIADEFQIEELSPKGERFSYCQGAKSSFSHLP